MTPSTHQPTAAERLAAALADGAKLLPPSIAKIDSCFCGCGNPTSAWEWVYGYLESRCAQVGRTGVYSEGAEIIAEYLLDHLGITEHGYNIAGAWLSDAGEEALAFLREHGCDWQESHDRGWVDGEGVYRTMPR